MAGPAGNCALTIARPTPLSAGQCLELNEVTVGSPCPVGFSTTRSVTFQVTAQTSRPTLSWRRAASSGDVLDPSSGTIAGQGQSEVTLADIVLDSTVTLEIVDGQTVLLRFTIRNF